MSNYVQNKVIVITGAASGFGKLLAGKAAAMGAKVVCADMVEDALKAFVEELTSQGYEATGVVADVTQKDQVFNMVDVAVKNYGRVDVMVNNAGIMPLAFIADHERALGAWEKCIDVNLKGVLYGICAVYDQMIAQGEGQIINISSIYGNEPVGGAAVYGMTKSGVVFLSNAVRKESKGKIRVTTVVPTGCCTTGLSKTVVNFEAGTGIFAHAAGQFFEEYGKLAAGTADPGLTDPESVKYFDLDPGYMADAILYTINQPMGVSLSDITVRASGDLYMQ